VNLDARRIRVVAAFITSDEGRRVLVQQRPPGKQRALLWEFPGGKVEAGETDARALRREAIEELGVELEVGAERFHVTHTYPDLEVDLHIYQARVVAGTPRPHQSGQVLREVPLHELGTLPFCEADRPLVEALLAETSEGPGRLPG
jgi:8-oxo-dGTP diphosphatase